MSMRESNEIIWVWGKVTDEMVIEKIKKSIQDFRSIGLEIDSIDLKYKEDKDRGGSNNQGEQEPFCDEKKK